MSRFSRCFLFLFLLVACTPSERLASTLAPTSIEVLPTYTSIPTKAPTSIPTLPPTLAATDTPILASTPLGTVYYVALDGDDDNPGTETLPWRTIQKAAETLIAGETVLIKAGTYPERVLPQNSGGPGNEIAYAAYPGDQVTIDGQGVTLEDDLAGLFQISGKSYIRVSGLRVINAGPHDNNAAILVNDSSYITLQGNHTYNSVSSGIGVWGSDHITVDGNTVEHACTGLWQECLTVAGTQNFEVMNNEVFDCQKEGLDAKDGAAYGQVHHNHVYNAVALGLYVDAWDKPTHDIQVFQNLVHDNGGDGFALASEAGGKLSNIYLYNNIAYHNRFVGISVTANGVSGPMQDIYILNNTIYDNGWQDWGGSIAVGNINAQNVVVRNNITSQSLYFQVAVTPGFPPQNVTIDHNLIDGYRGHEDEGETRGEDYVEGDPLFVDVSSFDFHLQSTSPAIDAASAQDAPGFDFDDHIRPQDGNRDGTVIHDIGAYEFTPDHISLYLPFIPDQVSSLTHYHRPAVPFQHGYDWHITLTIALLLRILLSSSLWNTLS